MTSRPCGMVLEGRWLRLEPARLEHAEDLFAALDDARVWRSGYGGGPAGRPSDVSGIRALLHIAVAAADIGERQAYVVRLREDSSAGAAGTVVGTSSLGESDLVNERVHLGWTAYGPSWWGGFVNPECKLLLLGHAFDGCGFGRVKIQTDAINERSQAAIARLGASREGVLRRHTRRADGTFRDTVVFSILKDEWPDVRQRLVDRLDRVSRTARPTKAEQSG